MSQPPQQFLRKLKIYGTGDKLSIAPLEPFYFVDADWNTSDNPITGSTNLIEHYGLKNAYQKYFRGDLKEELSGFLPHLPGNVNIPASTDDSGLMRLIENPPISGKELTPFPASLLEPAVRLHPGPLPAEYMALFTAPASQNFSGGGSSTTATGTTSLPGSESSPFTRKRRRDVHRVTGGGLVASESALPPPSIPGVSTPSSAALLLRNQQGQTPSPSQLHPHQQQQQQQHHHHHQQPQQPVAASIMQAPHSGPMPGASRPGFYPAPTSNTPGIRRPTDEFRSFSGGLSSVESPRGSGLEFDEESRRKRRKKEKKAASALGSGSGGSGYR